MESMRGQIFFTPFLRSEGQLGLGKVLTLAEPTRVTGVKEGEALVFKKNGPQRP